MIQNCKYIIIVKDFFLFFVNSDIIIFFRIEGLTGDRNIYKRRGENDPEVGFFQQHPKKMYFLFDLSAR